MDSQEIKKKQIEIENYYNIYIERQHKVGVNARHHSIIDKCVEVGLNNNHNVLEIGCGIGTFTSLLIKKVKNGQIISMDISGESIKLATNLYQQKNLQFVHADVVEYDFENNIKFDFIILPDVLEHIPINLHAMLFEKLSKLITNNGVVFIHIPNPKYLEWCHEHRPDLLQVIDQPINTDVLCKNTYPYGFYIETLKTYSIWLEEKDYQYIVLRKKKNLDFTKSIETKINLWERIRGKLKF